MLLLDARRTALVAVVPALAAIGVVAARRALLPGLYCWDNVAVALAAAVRLMAPLAAVVAAWAAIRMRRLDFLRGLGARSPATGPLLDLLLLTLGALVSYGLAALVLVVEIAPPARPGTAHALGLLGGAAALTLYVVAGYLAGRLVPRPAVVAATGLVCGAWAALRPPDRAWWSLLPPTVLGRVPPYTTLRAEVLADQACWSLGVAGAMVTAYVLAVTRRRAVAPALALVLGVAVIGTVRLASADGTAVVASRAGHVCRRWPLTICVHPGLRQALPALEATLTPLAARLSRTPAAFTRVVQRPEARPAGVWDGTAHVHLPDLTPGFELRVVRQILAGERGCERSGGYRRLVDGWLLGSEQLGEGAGIAATGADRAAQRFASWGEARRRAWLGRHFTEYRTCALTGRNFR